MATVSPPVLIDAHVHIHAAAEAPAVLDAAVANFARVATRLGHAQWSGVLLLAEMKQAAWFEAMAAGATTCAGAWSLRADPQDELVLRARRHDRELLILAGRQVATREGVEVLALATRARLPDGEPLQQTLQRAAAEEALLVLPWGAGKWTGRRRQLVHAALQSQSPPVMAGDSGGRPAIWPVDRDFAVASGPLQRALISGTDPLPLPDEAQRVGSFGCWLAGPLPAVRPGHWLREQLRNATTAQLQPFGAAMPAARFVRKQLALRLSRRRAPAQDENHDKPDIETSSAGYARRFAGPAGQFLLDTQTRAIAEVLRDLPPGRALDVGGGHGQLVPLLRSLGWQVTVQGTDRSCEHNLRELHGRRDCTFMLGDLLQLPAEDRSYDLVIAVRLVSHVPDWPQLLAEMCRVASRAVVIDYPTRGGINSLSGRLFGLKRAVEGNTRTYISFSHDQVQQVLHAHRFNSPRRVKQFVLPMVAHRLGRGSAPLRMVESLGRTLGLTAMVGSPVILRVDRQ